MKNKYINIALASSILYLSSCTPKTDVPAATKGDIDVSKYVAIGNSITSGFADAALYYDGQIVSYPNLLAKQFMEIGGGTFTQPLVPQNSVGIGSTGNAKLILGIVDGELSPIPAAASGDSSIWRTSVAASGPFNNMGVPGAKATTTVYPGYGNPLLGAGNYNPYFYRMTTAPTTASILSDAASQAPTFFSMFIGSNDVLAYALTGGASDAITPIAGAAGIGFDASIDAIVNTMTANGAKGVIANIPDITTIPFFTTVPYNPLTSAVLGNKDTAAGSATITALNAGLYGPLKQALTAFGAGDRINLLSASASNPLLIKDSTLPNLSLQLTAALTPSLGALTATVFGQIYGQARQATANDYILLSSKSAIGATIATAPSTSINKNGISYPMASQYVLTQAEAAAIKTATTAFNAKLKAVAESKSLAFVDVNAFLAKVKETGIHYNGRDITATFVTGGAFSLDGIHLTPLGNAMLANQFIDAINGTYGSTIKEIDASNYIGVKFP
ncbi:SGNH/GDSL hydrolase family protein [Rhizosphaericola mali]|uniref:G-D-S-L family lipolytic protein n=1 Tax=Rhizosphaericola mali TaxID=2545455 RepID=A0A5P2G0T2_9BACT|nr:hypothetical protein [Rhizosphaericola mali]QES89416.1 hypothetical protein E0W69_012325 [Rhizosphaericola mali]